MRPPNDFSGGLDIHFDHFMERWYLNDFASLYMVQSQTTLVQSKPGASCGTFPLCLVVGSGGPLVAPLVAPLVGSDVSAEAAPGARGWSGLGVVVRGGAGWVGFESVRGYISPQAARPRPHCIVL